MAAYCTCTAELQGGCNHVVGMLFRVESFVTIGATKPSSTGVLCTWAVPSGGKVDFKPTQAEDLFFTKAKYISDNVEKLKNLKISKEKFKN